MDDDKPRDADEHETNEPYDLEEEEPPVERQRLDADFLLDKVIPDQVDWRDLVRRHPMLSVGVAAALGFVIGRAKGATIVAGASAAVSAAVMRQLSDALDGEGFDF